MSVFLFALALAAQSSDAAAAPAAAAPVETAKPAKEKRICRAATEQTASRMRKRECLTETEWARRDAGKSAADLKTIGGR